MNEVSNPAPAVQESGVMPEGSITAGRNTQVPRRRPSWLQRIAVAGLSLVLMLGVVLGGLIVVLRQGPVALDFMSERIASALEERLGSGIDVAVGKTVLEKSDHGLELHVQDVVLRDSANREILRSPDAVVTFDTLKLVGLRLAPKSLSFNGVTLTAIITAQSEIILSSNSSLTDDAINSGAIKATEVGLFLIGMSKSGQGEGLESLSLANGSLKVEDRRNGKQLAFDRISLAITTPAQGRLLASGSLTKEGETVPVTASLEADGSDQIFRMQIENIGDGIVQALAGASTPFVKLGAKLAKQVDARFDETGKLLSIDTAFSAGKGTVTIPSIDPLPYLIDTWSARYRWTAASGKPGDFSVSYAGDGSSWGAEGLVEPLADGLWRWRATGRNWRIKPVNPAEQPPTADRVDISLTIEPVKKLLVLERMELGGGGTAISLSGRVQVEEAGPSVSATLSADRMPLRNALHWWPSFIAPDPRRFLLRTVKEGDLTRLAIKLTMPPHVLARAMQREALPVDAFQLEGAVENVAAHISDGMPPVVGLAGTGAVTAVSGQGVMQRGFVEVRPGRRVQLNDGTFALNGLETYTPDALFRFRSTAPLDTVVELLKAPDLKGLFSVELNPQNVKGQFEGSVAIALPLAGSLKPSQIRTEVTGKMTGVTIEKAIGQDRLDNATLNVTTDKTGIEIKGEGRWQGIPVTLTLENDANDRSLATVIGITLDDAVLRRRGVALGSRLSGPLPTRIKTLQESGEKWTAAIEVDLTRATIDGLLPGFQKPAGRAGKLTFNAVERSGGGFMVDNFVLDSGASSFRGQLEVLADGTPQLARFSLFRLSPGDNVKLDADRQGNGVKIVVRGNNLDARPFLRTLNQAPSTRADPEKGDVDIDIRATLLSGHGGEVLTGAEVRLQARNGQPRQILVSGKLNGKSVSVTGRSTGDGPAPLTMESDDAGAFLRYLDIYSRMQGGSISGQIIPANRSVGGYLIAKDFILRNEPAIRRLVTEAVPDQARQATTETRFTKMRIDFTREGTETTVKEAVIFGPQIGLTFNGLVDPGRDRISLSGTFIPAYGLNNAFAQIPVLGALLGGGRNEGLLAVTFGVSGRASNPNVTVNPLSAVAPGIFRKIFEFRNDTTSTVPPLQ
jgi:hypothetical protein